MHTFPCTVTEHISSHMMYVFNAIRYEQEPGPSEEMTDRKAWL